MKTWMRAWLVLAVAAAIIVTLSAGVVAGPPAAALGPGSGQNMTLMKAEVDKPKAAPGEEVRFLLQIKSTGTRELDGPRVIYDAPAGISIISATSTRGKNIDVWEKRADVDVVNLMYGDSVDITIVARIKSDVPVGTAIVSNFQISSASVGAVQASLGVLVVAPGATAAAGSPLPKAGGGIFLLLLGIVLAVTALGLRGVRSRRAA